MQFEYDTYAEAENPAPETLIEELHRVIGRALDRANNKFHLAQVFLDDRARTTLADEWDIAAFERDFFERVKYRMAHYYAGVVVGPGYPEYALMDYS